MNHRDVKLKRVIRLSCQVKKIILSYHPFKKFKILNSNILEM